MEAWRYMEAFAGQKVPRKEGSWNVGGIEKLTGGGKRRFFRI